jgi:hypothetical protein
MWSPDGTTTGQSQTGLTSPTYTYVADLAPDISSRQYVVTALGGTQTNVRVSTSGDPFTLLIRRDKSYKTLPPPNPVTGAYPNVPLNKTELLFRKGLKIDSAGTIRVGNLRIIAELPAGSETSDAVNVRAMLSWALGLLDEESADFGDSLIAGVWGA